MPETLSHPEHEKPLEKIEHQHERPAAKTEATHHETAHEHQQRLHEARQHIKSEAATASSNPLDKLEASQATPEASSPQFINRELKQITLRRELQHIRRKLPAPERAFSRVIHQPFVRTVSEVAGQSVSRPSGLLGGGLLAFIGSAGYLYMAKHIGFTYNYGIFVLLFIGGFILGLVLEFLVYWLAASRRRMDS